MARRNLIFDTNTDEDWFHVIDADSGEVIYSGDDREFCLRLSAAEEMYEALDRIAQIQRRWYGGLSPSDKLLGPGTVAKTSLECAEKALAKARGEDTAG